MSSMAWLVELSVAEMDGKDAATSVVAPAHCANEAVVPSRNGSADASTVVPTWYAKFRFFMDMNIPLRF